MNRKQNRIERLLAELAKQPMCRHNMAKFLGVSVVFVSRYITQLRDEKRIYIVSYERTDGKPRSFYAVGNQPDAPKLEPLTSKILQRAYRERIKRNYKPSNFKPKMDIAASWLMNPC